jgi:hypothetical protein
MGTRGSLRLAVLTALCLGVASASALAQTDKELLKIGRSIRQHSCPVITDPAGNAAGNPVDFTRLFVGNDDANVYFVVEFAGPAADNVSSNLQLNTDYDQNTGCNFSIPRLNGSEYGVFFYDPAFSAPFVGNMTACAAGSDDFPDRGGVHMVIEENFTVLSVPIATLQILQPDVSGFFVWVNGGGAFGPAAYQLQ